MKGPPPRTSGAFGRPATSRSLKPPPPACPNCGTHAPDRFCPRCGQRTGSRMVSMGALLREVLEDQLSLEGRLPRTLGKLLGRPGQLTADYAAGRIARYIPPFRLYLVAGLLFVATVSYVATFERVAGRLMVFVDPVTGQAVEGAEVVIVSIPIDTLRMSRPLVPLVRRYVQQQDRVNVLPAREAGRAVYGGTVGRASGALLLLVPGFALLLKALYRRRLYVEHTVFVLHLHTALFLLALPAILLRRWWLTAALAAWAAVYLFLALRRAYGESGARTAWKFLLLLLSYPVAFIVVMVAVTMFAVLTF